MQPVPRVWEPANDVERTLRYAWEREDGALLLRTLAFAPLYLPGFSAGGRGAATEQPQRMLTRQRGDRTYLLVFTSAEALYEGVGEVVDGWRLTSMAELVREWPDQEWGLAVSPSIPIGAYLGPDEMASLADLVADEPVFHPADPAEAMMYRAQRSGDPGSYLDMLVMSEVLLPLTAPAAAADLTRPEFPWRVETVDDLPTVSVFTSPQRLADGISGSVPTVRVDMVVLLRAWPDPNWRLAVNPGSAIPSMFPGGQVPDLFRWAQALIVRMEDGPVAPVAPAPVVPAPVVPGPAVPASPAAAPTPLAPPPPIAARDVFEVVIDQAEVDRYLGAGHDRVSGVVYRAGTAPVPARGHLVRWHHQAGTGAAPADGDVVEDLTVPSGARLIQLNPGEKLLATYQAELRRWIPAVADLLRGLTG